ncbi:MAG: transcriptional regulator [Thermoproteota archaeon]|nr:MAG: transcriptional regulator [Candidatus Korarchaeota archaeon]
MPSEKLLGSGLMIISLAVIIVYAWLLFFTKYSLVVLKVTVFMLVLVLFSLIGWVGYTIVTTPVPKQD